MTLLNLRQRSGSVVMLHDCDELRTDFAPRWLTVTYHASCQQGHGIGKRLIDAQADADLATLRAHDLPVARAQIAADLAGAIDDLATRLR
jgi:hypothetical protein